LLVVHEKVFPDEVGTAVDIQESEARVGDENFAAVTVDQHVRRLIQVR
jgi:hypothetical protein